MTQQRVPVARPALDEREAEAVRRVIMSGWVTQGPEVAAFEHLEGFFGVPAARHVEAAAEHTLDEIEHVGLIIDHEQLGRAGLGLGQERERGQTDQEPVGCAGVREPDRRTERLALGRPHGRIERKRVEQQHRPATAGLDDVRVSPHGKEN